MTPRTIEFNLPERYNKSPGTSLYINKDGAVFIGKENGLLVIDNESSYFFYMNDPVYISATGNDKLIYLTGGDFGHIQYTAGSGPVLVSDLEEIRSNYQDFFPINATTFKDNVFLATSEGVIVLGDSTIEHHFLNRKSLQLSNSGNSLFLHMENGDLYTWNGRNFVPTLTYKQVNNASVDVIIDLDSMVFMVNDRQEFFLFSILSGLERMDETRSPFGKACRPVMHLSDSLILCSGENNYPLFISPGLSEIIPLALPGGRTLSGLKAVFTDRFGDTWMLYDYNLYKFEHPSAIEILDLTGIIGSSILDLSVEGDTVYVAAGDGLFRLDGPTNRGWKPTGLILPGDAQVNIACSRDNLAVFAGNEGLYISVNNTLRLVDKGRFTFVTVLDSNTILAANTGVLSLYTDSEGFWQSQTILDSMVHVASYEEYNDFLWLLTDGNELIQMNGSGAITGHFRLKIPAKNGELFIYREKLALRNSGKVYVWDAEAGMFTKLITYRSKSHTNSGIIFEDRSNTWSLLAEPSGTIVLRNLSDTSDELPDYELMLPGDFGNVTGITQAGNCLWISGRNKLIRVRTDLGKKSGKDMLSIHSVIISAENEEEQDILVKQGGSISYTRNPVIIHLENSRHIGEPGYYYRYRLTHYQDKWSEWSKSSSYEFPKLKERNYEFQAQSASPLGALSEPVEFHFTVTPPIFRSWFAYLIYSLLLSIAVFLVYKWRLLQLKRVEYKMEERIKERMATVLSEKEKSDKLVADLFPKGTAEELKAKGRAESKKFEMVTVLFSDIQGFTKIAEEMNPEVLIDELDKFFFHFDSVVEKYNIEKIKTIGDAYMAAGGIPVKNRSNPVEVVLAGIEMQNYMNDLKKKKTDIWDLRIGIHTGPVISGVVGHKKLSYDIWGDTVNTASRMESSGEGGKVNISGTTFSLVKEFFICEYRGKLPVKYKGNIDMYFVVGLRPELSVDLHGIPNKRFFLKVQLLRLQDIEEKVFEEILEDQLLNLHFHKREYLIRVFNQAELLSRSENLGDDEILLTQTAAILLYSGLSVGYDNFEHKSADIARSILPEFGYDEIQIDRVANLILSTKAPFNPQNKLEAVLIDAKMEYLGRSDYMTLIKLQYLEEKNLLKDISPDRFKRTQLEILKDFDYYTLAARRLREISAEDQINQLKSWK